MKKFSAAAALSVVATLLTGLLAPGSFAQPGEAIKIYENAPEVRVGRGTAVLPVTLYGYSSAQATDELRLEAVALLDDLLPKLASALEAEASARNDCERRWSAWDGKSSIANGSLLVSVTLRADQWKCTRLFGDELKTRLARETGRIHAVLTPQVRDGRLAVTLTDFRVDDLSHVSRQFGVEEILRDAINRELDKFNADSSKTALPGPLAEIGFRYETVDLANIDGTPTARISIVGPNRPVELLAAVGELTSAE